MHVCPVHALQQAPRPTRAVSQEQQRVHRSANVLGRQQLQAEERGGRGGRCRRRKEGGLCGGGEGEADAGRGKRGEGGADAGRRGGCVWVGKGRQMQAEERRGGSVVVVVVWWWWGGGGAAGIGSRGDCVWGGWGTGGGRRCRQRRKGGFI